MTRMNNYERAQNYRLHRMRVQKATSLVDSQAPKQKRRTEDQREMSYIEMLQSIFIKDSQRALIQLPDKITDDYSTLKYCLSKQLQYLAHQQEEREAKNSSSNNIPAYVFRRYEQLNLVRNDNILQQLLRPCIYMDLEINKLEALGRLEIQLFTEACPEVVLQFVRCCLFKQNTRFNISRLLCPLWLEAELALDDMNALTSSSIEHDTMAINHGISAGILSFPSRYLRGSKFRFITFTISFTPINVLNGKRIAFGIIKRGHNVLDRLQGLKVTRCGKPSQNITVSTCGVLNC